MVKHESLLRVLLWWFTLKIKVITGSHPQYLSGLTHSTRVVSQPLSHPKLAVMFSLFDMLMDIYISVMFCLILCHQGAPTMQVHFYEK